MAAAVAILAALAAAAPAHAKALKPFGHTCTPQSGVRFCPTSDPAQRVPSWDKTPIDVDVTLPAHGKGPFPTLVMLHGFTGKKTDFEAPTDANGARYDNVWFAKRGYAVVNPSIRGFGGSCNDKDSRTADCDRGWMHVADQRYDTRDIQYLIGLLVDQKVADAKRVGVTGVSLGSLISMELAFLKSRVRRLDGSFEPWRSPRGVRLKVAAAYPTWAIASLVNLLLPNGRLVDTKAAAPAADRTPLGVGKLSFATVSLAAGPAGLAFVAPPGADPDADFNSWFATGLTKDDPADPDMNAIAAQLGNYHQAFGLGDTAAPLLIQSGWADQITAPDQALLVYNILRARNPRAKVSIQLADVGHNISANRPEDHLALNTEGTRFLDHYLRRRGRPPAPGSVTARTQVCAGVSASRARGWSALHPGKFTLSAPASQTLVGNSGDPALAAQVDPLASTACTKHAVADAPGTVVLTKPVTTPFTLLGFPTITATIRATGKYGQIDARLWDVGPDGQQTLVTRGVYRLTDSQSGTVSFQMMGGGWRFAAGHTVRVELLGADSPFLAASKTVFTVAISDLSVVLPNRPA